MPQLSNINHAIVTFTWTQHFRLGRRLHTGPNWLSDWLLVVLPLRRVCCKAAPISITDPINTSCSATGGPLQSSSRIVYRKYDCTFEDDYGIFRHVNQYPNLLAFPWTETLVGQLGRVEAVRSLMQLDSALQARRI